MGTHELEDDVASDDNEAGADSSEEERYPPWLHQIVEGEYYNIVRIVKEEDDNSQPGYVRCKEIIVPDTADAADNRKEIRKYHLKKFSIVMIVSEPSAAPYIGLVEKIWRNRKAKPHKGVDGVYTTSDFMLECYWFYRPKEVPDEAWDMPDQPRRKDIRGAQYAWSKRSKPQVERKSERQLLFSSHHTRHDYPDQNGLLSLEGFLQICEPVHWIGLEDPAPEKYRIHGGQLIRKRERGFIVQGFLWCNAKDQEQLDNKYKRVYQLDSNWGDRETLGIVQHMVKKYKKRAEKVEARSVEILEKYTQFRLRQRAGQAVSPLVSEAADDLEQQQQQQQTQQVPRGPLQRVSVGTAGDGRSKAPPYFSGGTFKHQGSGSMNSQRPETSKPAGSTGVFKKGSSGAKTQQQQQQQEPRPGPGTGAKIKLHISGLTQRDAAATASSREPQQQQHASSNKQAAAAAAAPRKHGEFGSDDDDD